jgi:hypothetical protein
VAKARLLPPYNTAISLVADVLETWFYMLTWKKELQQPDTPVEDNWKEYARIITSERSNKVIQGLRKFWSAKVGFYSMAIQSIKIDRKAADAVDELYKKQLQKRRASLRLLLLLVHNNLPV